MILLAIIRRLLPCLSAYTKHSESMPTLWTVPTRGKRYLETIRARSLTCQKQNKNSTAKEWKTSITKPPLKSSYLTQVSRQKSHHTQMQTHSNLTWTCTQASLGNLDFLRLQDLERDKTKTHTHMIRTHSSIQKSTSCMQRDHQGKATPEINPEGSLKRVCNL